MPLRLRRGVLVIHVVTGSLWLGLLVSVVIETPSTAIIWTMAIAVGAALASGTVLMVGSRLSRYRWVRVKGDLSIAVAITGTACIVFLPPPISGHNAADSRHPDSDRSDHPVRPTPRWPDRDHCRQTSAGDDRSEPLVTDAEIAALLETECEYTHGCIDAPIGDSEREPPVSENPVPTRGDGTPWPDTGRCVHGATLGMCVTDLCPHNAGPNGYPRQQIRAHRIREPKTPRAK